MRYHALLALPLCWLAVLCSARAADPFSEHVRSTDPRPAAEQRGQFRLPPGFVMQLVASEPDIAKPMNLAFDDRGRLWVTDTYEYPFPAPLDRPGRDAIKVLEDFDESGRARKITTFVDGLNIPIGLYPYQNGVIAWSIPNIWFFQDTDGDGKADKREVLYGPFDHTRDTHGNQASFRRGFDGWLYATHGFNNDSRVRGQDGHEVHMNSGNTYRMQLDGSRLEHWIWGQVNPFGLAWDPRGNLYSSDCHSAPVYQLLAGGYYPSFGKPHDGLGFAPALMEHSHGSTAIDGMLYYADNLWPEEFHDNTFIGNVMTSRVNRDRLVLHGSSPSAVELEDFVVCDDPWFRPVDNHLGPDGALYIADFYNRIIGHYEVPLAHPGRDRERGRIWRVVYQGKRAGLAHSENPPKTGASPAVGSGLLRSPYLPPDLTSLIAELGSPSLARRMLAMNSIYDRFGEAAAKPLANVLERPVNAFQRVHVLWLLDRLDALADRPLLAAAKDPDPLLRTHAMRIMAERGRLSSRLKVNDVRRHGFTGALAEAARAGLQDTDPLVQRCAAEALGTVPHFVQVRPLLALRHVIPAADTHLLYVVRKALRDQLNDARVFANVMETDWTETDLLALADVAIAVRSPQAASFLLRHMAALSDRNGAAPSVAEILKHAARHAPEQDLSRLASLSAKRLPSQAGPALFAELNQQFVLFKSVDEGLQQRGVTIPSDIRQWGADVVRRFFETIGQAHAWSNRILEANPTPNPWDLESRMNSEGQPVSLISSFPHGEPLTGTLRTPEFIIPAELSFWLCGHDGAPDRPAMRQNRVCLREAGTDLILAETFAPRQDVAQRVSWNLRSHQGKRGYVEAIDALPAPAYAWIAFGGFESGLRALRTPDLSPRKWRDGWIAATEMAVRLGVPDFVPLWAGRALPQNAPASDADPDVLAALARGWSALAPEKAVEGLSQALTHPQCQPAYRERLGVILGESRAPVAHEAVIAAMKLVPFRIQILWALTLAANGSAAETLLAAAESGRISPRLLQPTGIRNRLQAAKPERWQARLEELTKALPPPSESVDRQMAMLRRSYAAGQGNPSEGKRVFDQSCAVCHQINGQGSLIGPQLDGIGQRGLERLIEDLADPNRNVDVAFRSFTFKLKDGDILTGLPRREEGEVQVLADATGKEFSVPKNQILERHESMSSLMPENFAEVLSRADFNHLLAYLLSQTARRESP